MRKFLLFLALAGCAPKITPSLISITPPPGGSTLSESLPQPTPDPDLVKLCRDLYWEHEKLERDLTDATDAHLRTVLSQANVKAEAALENCRKERALP